MEISFENQNYKVDEILSEDFGYILYQHVNGPEYFLFVVKNHSAAYYSVTVQLTKQQALDFINAPSYSKALSLAS